MRDTMRRIGPALYTARAAGILAVTLAFAPRAAGQTAQELLDAHAEALGGRAALEAVETIRRAGDSRFESPFTGEVEGRAEMGAVVGEKVYRSSDMGAFSSTSAWDGSFGWEQGPQGFRELMGDELRMLRLSTLPFLTAGVGLSPDASLSVEEGGEIDGVPHDVLVIEGEQTGKLTVFLDRETHLAVRSVQSAELPNLGPTKVTVDIFDYAAHGGVMLPGRVKVSVPGIFTMEMVFDETEINPEIDPKRFEAPQ